MPSDWLYVVAAVVVIVGGALAIGLRAGRAELAARQRDDADITRLMADVGRLTAERDRWYAQAIEVERRSAESDQRRAEAERQLHEERRQRIDAERAVANGAELMNRLESMQAEIVQLRGALTRATAEIRDLRKHVDARPEA